MFGLGWPEVVVIGVLGVLIFGPKKLPELGGALGKTLRGFREGMSDMTEEEEDFIDGDRD